MSLPNAAAGLQRLSIFQAFSRHDQFNRDSHFRQANNRAQLGRTGHTHRNVIFFAAVSRHVINAGRMGEHLCFIQERRRHDLQHHEYRGRPGMRSQKRRQVFVRVRIHQTIDATLGNAHQVSDRHRRIVERQREWRTVKVSARKHFTRINEDQRIVRRTASFDLDDPACVCQSIAHGPVNLRHTAERVRVLHARIVLHVRLSNLAVAQKLAQMFRDFSLSRVWTRAMNSFVKSHRRSF